MIRDWRAQLESGEFPFFIVQLANFMARKPEPGESGWAELREAQFLTTKALPQDRDRPGHRHRRRQGHPPDQQAGGRPTAGPGRPGDGLRQGRRVLRPGLQGDGGQGRNAIRLTFDHLGGGLVAKGGGKLEGFAVAGEDGKYAWADATIEGDAVVVSLAPGSRPRNVRYAWADNPACNLYNQAGLPAVPFRTDGPAK